MRALYLPLFLVALCSGGTAQMAPGDALVCVNSEVQVNRGGQVVGRYPLPVFWCRGLAMGSQNENVIVATPSSPGGAVHVLTPAGTFTALTTLSSRADRVAIDEDGYVLAAAETRTGQVEIVRIDPAGQQTTIRSPVLGTRAFPSGLAVDVATGDWLVGSVTALYRMRPSGQTAVVTGSLMFVTDSGIASDPRTGFALIGSGNSIMAVDLRTAAVVPFALFPQTREVPGIAYDRARDDFRFVITMDSGFSRIDAKGWRSMVSRSSVPRKYRQNSTSRTTNQPIVSTRARATAA